MFGISLARISLLTGTSLGGGVGVSPTLDLNFRGQGYSAAMAGYTFNQLIDFTRTSAATYVDATGKIVPTAASRNLLTFTQEFDNAAWVKNSSSISANSTTAPDGTLTADTLTANGENFTHLVRQTVSSGFVRTFSIYLKAGTNNFAQLYFDGDGAPWANFDLATGVVGSTGTNQTATITSVGNGWYRCAVTTTSLTATSPAVCIVTSASAGRIQANTLTTSIFLWGAQLEAVPDANLVLGSERVTNGDFASGSTGWTLGTGWAVASGQATFTANSTNSAIQQTGFPPSSAGKTYRISYTVVSNTLNGGFLRVGGFSGGSFFGSAAINVPTSVGQQTQTIVVSAPSGAGNVFDMWVTSGATSGAITLDNISVKEITGTTGMPTDYTRNVGGVFPPRFDYDPVTLAPKGLLVEEQRTNLLLRSEEFDNASWVKSATGTATAPVVTANAAISPDGTMDADLVVFDRGAGTGSDRSELKQTPSLSAGTYTQSVWLKAATPSDVGKQLALRNVAAATFSVVTLTADWVRYTRTEVWVANNWEITNRYGVTADITVSAHIWGAQLEAGAFATSYIPTVASQVTRTADVATITGANFSQWFNSSQGTLLVEASQPAIFASSKTAAAVSDGVNNRIAVYRQSAGGVNGFVTPGFGALASGVSASANVPWKGALAYTSTDGFFSANGSSIASGPHLIPLSSINNLSVGNVVPGGVEHFNGHIRSIRYFPTRLSNAQLQALTA